MDSEPAPPAGDRRARARLGASAAAILLITMPLALQGCAVQWAREHPLYCPMQEQSQIRDALYFGRSIPGGGEVTDAEWQHFETDVISRAFPHGFTVLDGHGAWRGAGDKTIIEPSHVVVILHAEDEAAESAIRDTITRYRSMFHQEAVLRERSVVCVSL